MILFKDFRDVRRKDGSKAVADSDSGRSGARFDSVHACLLERFKNLAPTLDGGGRGIAGSKTDLKVSATRRCPRASPIKETFTQVCDFL